MGLPKTGRIAEILINPKDTDNVLVCAEGSGAAPQHERGVFRTTDGGRTCKQTLVVTEETCCSGLSMDPANPDTDPPRVLRRLFGVSHAAFGNAAVCR
jgi:hypothetical protein